MPFSESPTVLVVDDLEQNRAVAGGHLESFGCRVIGAESGERALEIFDREPVDLVLLDLLMPGMDGFETCRELRKRARGTSTPIVFLTALEDVDVQTRAMECGADDFLTKPIRRVELLLRVRSLVRVKRLQSQLESANDALTAQRDALVESAMARRRIAAMVVHDLKSPLASLLGNGRYILDTPGVPEDARESAADVLAAAERMHRMVVDLLDIARADEARLVPRPARFDVARLIEGCRATMQRVADARRQTVAIDVRPGTVANADHDLCRRVLENLVDNALAHAPAASEVVVRAAREERALLLRVEDRGAGVPDARKLDVFEAYVQLASGEPTREGSRGLGLAFCRLAVEAHGGSIWVEDNTPGGAVFCARFPDS